MTRDANPVQINPLNPLDKLARRVCLRTSKRMTPDPLTVRIDPVPR